MARPTKLDDLESYEREPHDFVRVDLQYITVDVKVGSAVLALIAAARESDAFTVDEDGWFRVTMPLTEKEIERKIALAQSHWDSSRDWYETALVDPSAIEKWKRLRIDQWAEAEGRPAIVWDVLEVVA